MKLHGCLRQERVTLTGTLSAGRPSRGLPILTLRHERLVQGISRGTSFEVMDAGHHHSRFEGIIMCKACLLSRTLSSDSRLVQYI